MFLESQENRIFINTRMLPKQNSEIYYGILCGFKNGKLVNSYLINLVFDSVFTNLFEDDPIEQEKIINYIITNNIDVFNKTQIINKLDKYGENVNYIYYKFDNIVHKFYSINTAILKIENNYYAFSYLLESYILKKLKINIDNIKGFYLNILYTDTKLYSYNNDKFNLLYTFENYIDSFLNIIYCKNYALSIHPLMKLYEHKINDIEHIYIPDNNISIMKYNNAVGIGLKLIFTTDKTLYINYRNCTELETYRKDIYFVIENEDSYMLYDSKDLKFIGHENIFIYKNKKCSNSEDEDEDEDEYIYYDDKPIGKANVNNKLIDLSHTTNIRF